MEHTFHQTMARAGSADHLVQTFTADDEHSFLTEPAYAPLMTALLGWSAGGAKPTPAQIAQQCPAFAARLGAGCRFRPDYAPPPLGSRVPPRSSRSSCPRRAGQNGGPMHARGERS